ncbi:MAG: hypothetical protein FJY75_02250 [Candidatus Eisenbacteria bacterium]|uniref:DNA-directed RNA polymerase subunit omega n=1 Tax=Eiseniibacteriota bacterium TaxID=2212470 RepID=A0A938BPW6_UNCEI|nr:hypothetical protein [Candidatus Eisenbacteria bacterium]
MVDEKNAPDAEAAAAAAGRTEEEILEPRSKYEMIMMAAAEASRLNEESRRKGTKISRKVTLEALKRVSEGKVKAVVTTRAAAPRGRPLMPLTESPDSLFSNPPLIPLSTPDEPDSPADTE